MRSSEEIVNRLLKYASGLARNPEGPIDRELVIRSLFNILGEESPV